MRLRIKKVMVVLLSCLLVTCMYLIMALQNGKQNTETKNKNETKTAEIKEKKKRERDSTLDEEIQAYLTKNEIDANSISYMIYDIEAQESYVMNEDVEFTAASIYKLPLAMLYYDKINSGELTEDTIYTFYGYMIEDEYMYTTGDQDTLGNILENMILYSNNNAAHCLFENLGGWSSYKSAMEKYINSVSENYYSVDNVTTAATIGDVLNYLYEHKADYSDLIETMSKAEAGNYLDTKIKVNMPQKYGLYDTCCNGAGFVEAKHPYTIVVLTDLGSKGVDVMASINEIVYNHFNND